MDAILRALLDEPDPITRYRVLTAAQGDFEALTRRIAIERARTVAGMHGAGLSYGRIAEELGFTRARAQQLSERADQPHNQQERTAPPMTEPEGLTDFLHGYVQDWPRPPTRTTRPPYGIHHGTFNEPVASSKSPEEIAVDLISTAEFQALRLGTWLSTPQGQVITAVVEAISPPLYREDITLITDALMLAARTQQKEQRGRVLTGAALATAGIALLVTGGKG
jgi:hypothetical protein